MGEPVVIDAGPALNFFATNSERLMFSVVGQIAVPETVVGELLGKARLPRFAHAEKVWRKVQPTKLVEVLDDDPDDDALDRAVRRLSSMPIEQRLRHPKDAGETMVIAHGVVRAEAGADIVLLIDDGGGLDLAAREAARLQRLARSDDRTGASANATTACLRSGRRTCCRRESGSLRRIHERSSGSGMSARCASDRSASRPSAQR